MLNKLIEQYLIIHQQCPLPGVGFLKLTEIHASINNSDKQINAPSQQISLMIEELSAEGFISFISGKQFLNLEESATELNRFCKELVDLKPNEEKSISQLGSFIKSEDDHLFFKQNSINHLYSPSLNLNRVIHPNNVHAVLVGDNELTNHIIAERLIATKTVVKYKWWAWAACLTIISMAIIFIYFSRSNFYNNNFGNINQIESRETVAGYQEF